MGKGKWRSVVLDDKQLYFITVVLSEGGECCILVLLPRDIEIVWSMGLLQRTSVTLVVAAGGHPSSLKITACEQLNFAKLGVSVGEKKPPAPPVLDEDLARKSMRLTALECKLCIYKLLLNLCNWLCHTSVEAWRYYLQKDSYLRKPWYRRKRIIQKRDPSFLGGVRGKNVFSVYRNWLSLHDAANG